MQYNLCDIHFHKNLFYDAYENESYFKIKTG